MYAKWLFLKDLANKDKSKMLKTVCKTAMIVYKFGLF